jgi:signal transduction histidine kinase
MLGLQLVLAVAAPLLRQWRGLSFVVAYLALTDALIELIMLMMVSLSATLLGKVIYGLLLLLAVLTHAWVWRVSWTQPYVALCMTLLMPFAALTDSGPENLILVGTLILGSFLLMLIVGTAAETQFRNQQRTAAERDAVAAQMLEQAHSEAAGWERQFTLLAGLHHDIGNLLTTAILKSDAMLRKLQSEHALVDSAEVLQGFGTINGALKTVSTLITEAKKSVPTQPTERVDLIPLLKSVAAHVGTSPTPVISFELPASAPVDVPGGEATLKRLFDNILRNALEGDGKRQARNIQVAVVDNGAAFTVSIADDGPGFPEHLLHGRVKGYFTTKTHGTGLGLVTAEALTSACRGTLRRSNRPEGGARVDVLLPRGQFTANADTKSVA